MELRHPISHDVDPQPAKLASNSAESVGLFTGQSKIRRGVSHGIEE